MTAQGWVCRDPCRVWGQVKLALQNWTGASAKEKAIASGRSAGWGSLTFFFYYYCAVPDRLSDSSNQAVSPFIAPPSPLTTHDIELEVHASSVPPLFLTPRIEAWPARFHNRGVICGATSPRLTLSRPKRPNATKLGIQGAPTF